MLDIMYKQTRRNVPLSPAADTDAKEEEGKEENKDDNVDDGHDSEPEDASTSSPASLREEVAALRREVAALRRSHERMEREIQELKGTRRAPKLEPKDKDSSTRASAGSEWLEAISTRLGLEAAISLRKSERRPTLAQE